MPITGSEQALMYCQSNVERCGASRTGYHSPKLCVSVGGVQRGYGKSVDAYKVDNVSITETSSGTPNRMSFSAHGFELTAGMEVIATLGSINSLRRLFGGVVLIANESNVDLVRTYKPECVDFSWLADGDPVYGHFTGSADTIATELMSTYAPADFTVRQVESGLATVTGGITFTGVKLSTALNRLAKRVGATQFIDYNKDLYFRVTPATDRTNPTAIVDGLDTLKAFAVSRDISQVANRVPFEGGGSDAMTEVSIGDTILPLTVAPDWWFGDVGGVVLTGPQKITYTARVEGGSGSVVGPGASPSSVPTLALAAGSGVTDGSHDVTVVFVTAAGRSLPSQVATITTGTVSAPSAAATAGTPSTGGSMNGGTHRYYPVFRTAAGSTTAGPVSNSVTAVAEVSAPVTTPQLSSDPAAGSLDVSAIYGYAYTFWDGGARETTLSPVATTTCAAPGSIAVKQSGAFPAPPSGFQRRWYRTEGGGATYKLMPYGQAFGQFATYTGDYWVDIKADSELGVTAPVANTTANGTCAVTGIPVSADGLVTHVDLYREFNSAGASTAKLAFSVTNGTTSGNDTLANSGLGATVPSSNTAAAGQIAASAIPIGGSGTTDRELYMSAAGGGARKRALALGDNSTTTGTITMSDATLAGELAEPGTDTSGLTQEAGQVLPGATTVLITGTAPFRSAGGWAFTGSQVIRYTSFSGSSLAGIPASGVGAILQPLPYNTVIAAAPCLIGIPASGDGSILYTIQKGDAVNLFVTVEDTDAQVALQAMLDADAPVVRECPPLQDRRLNRDEAIARATAFLTLRAYPGVRVGPYKSKDMNNRAGSEVSITLTSPATVNDTFKIQSVTINNFTPNLPPDYTVQASDELFSIEDLLAREPG